MTAQRSGQVIVLYQGSRRRRNLKALLVIAVLYAVATALAFDIDPRTWFSRDSMAAPTAASAPGVATSPAPSAVPPLPAGSVPDYRAIVRQAGPAVVGVMAAGLQKVAPDGVPPAVEQDPFFQFFRGLPGFPWRPPEGEQPFRSQGSGFIISSEGVILTNAHVVREAREVSVKLSDRREFVARVIGADTVTDVAVLRIDAQNLPVVRLGDAQQLQVGDPVLAIGSPFGFEQSATQGIVSAKGRSLPGDAAVPFIQTDAAVNPGNSGGPLFDGSGAVVGINAQIYSRSGGFQGLSFAIPINVALKVKDQILATGRASHARLGVTVQDLNQGLAESFGLARPDGALIAGVAARSAAAKAGLQPGDVVTALNGEPILRAGDLSNRIGMAAPGETVRLKVWRDKASRDLSATLDRVEDTAKAAPRAAPEAPAGQLGLRLRPLTNEERAQAQVEGGLLIQGVSGPTARAGLQAGDLLLAVNGVPVSTIEQLRAVMDKKPRRVALLIERDGERLFVPVDLR